MRRLGVLLVLPLGLLVAPVPAGAQQPEKRPAAPAAATKVKASAYNLALEGYYLIVQAGSEQGFFARSGLEPEWVTREGRAIALGDLKDLIAQGTHLGMSSPSEILLARIQGLPVKFVAGYVGETLVSVYAKADGPVRIARDLDGRKIGPTSAAVLRQVGYLSRKLGIRAEGAPFANLDANVAALTEGRIDAIITAEARALALVDRGELRLVFRSAVYRPSPELNNALWATDELIRENPAVVGRFVAATLDTVKYLKDHPAYAATLIARKTGMSAQSAAKVAALFDWTPSGQPGGDLVVAATNYWQVLKETGAVGAGVEVKIEEMVDTRFLQ